MLNQTQAPVMTAPTDESYIAVRMREMRMTVENPFSLCFLFWMHERLFEKALDGLSEEQAGRVETLLMFNTCIHKAEYKDLRGFELDILTDIVAKSTHMIAWE